MTDLETLIALRILLNRSAEAASGTIKPLLDHAEALIADSINEAGGNS